MSQLPFVSVIVPTRNRPAALARCVESLAAQAYPRACLQILVVNDGGTPVSRGILDPEGALPLEVIDIAHAGPAAARNAGVARARGDILAFTDDDCYPDPQWLGAMAARLASHPEAAVGGHVDNGLPDNRYARASQLLVSYLYRYYHEQGLGDIPFFTTNNLAMSADTFAKVGPFDASFPFASEDRDWSDRCVLASRPLVYAPEALVHHAHALTLATFIVQHFRYGQGARRFHHRRAARRQGRVRLEPSAFYGGMIRASFGARDPEPVRVAMLIMASQIAGAVGWAVTRDPSRRRHD